MAEAKPKPKVESKKSKVKPKTVESAVEEAVVEAKPAKKVTKAGPKAPKAIKTAEVEAERKEKAVEKVEAKVEATNAAPRVKKRGKNYRAAAELIDKDKYYELVEAIELAKQTAKVKFDASVEMHVNLGVDPKQADQMVRASVVLPAGTGREVRVATITADDDKQFAKIEKGQIDFDILITTPDMMPKIAKLAKILGPKGLMPNPKSGTVTTDIDKAVKEAKGGKVEFRIDKQAIVHQVIGKVSFKSGDLVNNATTFVSAIMKAKPSAAKGTYVLAMNMSTSMGPGIKLDSHQVIAETQKK